MATFCQVVLFVKSACLIVEIGGNFGLNAPTEKSTITRRRTLHQISCLIATDTTSARDGSDEEGLPVTGLRE